MVKVLMVDVDGVVVRGRPDDGRPWADRLLEDLGIGIEALVDAFFRPHFHDVMLGRAALRDRLAPALAEMAADVSADVLIDYWFAQDARLDDALLADLAAVRAQGVALHLATNQEHERADHLWRALGLNRHFDVCHYSAALGVAKPDAAFFHAVAARVGHHGGDLLLIDDRVENVDAARDAGWRAAVWTGEHRLFDVLAAEGLDVTKP